MTADTLPAETLPGLDIPAADPAAELPDLDPPPGDDQEQPGALSPDDLEAVERHIDGIVTAAAQAGAQMFPKPLQAEYMESFTGNVFIRAGVRMSGAGEALHELLPPAGPGGPAGGAPAAVRRLHPVARLALGALVLGVGLLVQGRQFQAAHAAGAPVEG